MKLFFELCPLLAWTGGALIFSLSLLSAETRPTDFSHAVILTPPQLDRLEKKALAVFQEEVEKRTGIRLPSTTRWPEAARSRIVVGTETKVSKLGDIAALNLDQLAQPGDEGFKLIVRGGSRPVAVVAGKDSRGVLYGVGRLLRRMELRPGSITIRGPVELSTSPRHPIRGQQLGNRDLNNTYDAWGPEQFEKYIRELALFGANCIELIPPDTADYPTERSNRPLPAKEMMVRVSEIIDDYGMDLGIWYPNTGKDYTTPDGIERELKMREEVFRMLGRIDYVWVPGGDPGRLHPDVLFPWLDQMARVLGQRHPRAKIWVSPQFMRKDQGWYDAFYAQVNRGPEWLAGVVFAPWGKTPLATMRELVRRDLPIRRCPDICHVFICQYPVVNLDLAFAQTLGREPILPRPRAFKNIHNRFHHHAIGSVGYSDGIADDVNKFVWLDQEWNPDEPVVETLRDYARLFIQPDLSEAVALGILALERNLDGNLADNPQIEVTFRQWQALEEGAPEAVLANPRFQMGLLRAYYDAYVKARLLYERGMEARARGVLDQARRTGAEQALDEAEAILNKATLEPVCADHRRRCFELADALRAGIGLQLSVERQGAIRRGRGAFMDSIDEPLNNAPWLLSHIASARQCQGEERRLEAIHRILRRTDPGPGGFYDDFGIPHRLGRILNPTNWQEDPSNLDGSVRISFGFRVRGARRTQTVEPHRYQGHPVPLSWLRHVATVFDTPLEMLYDGLDPTSAYTVRAVYPARISGKIRMVADDEYPVHDFLELSENRLVEFPVPYEATRDGKVKFSWTCRPTGKGSQVAELWLMRRAQ